MRTNVYVDGFNLYFRLLRDRPALRWLNLKVLAEQVLRPENVVQRVRYYTARVSEKVDAAGPAKQQIYLDALATVPEITVHMGSFLATEKWARLIHPPDFRPAIDLPEPWPTVVKVQKIEEKGSDVNLASHLLLDAFRRDFDVAAVVSNDTDLVEPIRIVVQELGLPVGLVCPVNRPAESLRQVASFHRHIRIGHLQAAQFEDVIAGTTVTRPSSWA